MSREYHGKSKCRIGPGGMGCPCCSPMGVEPRKSKPLMRRIVRRTTKQEVQRELQAAE